jgi:hypothetical protein
MRIDETGEFWGAIFIGAAVGIVSQYISDVIYNVVSGKTGADILIPTSSGIDYIAAGLSGALATTGISALGMGIANAVIDGITYLMNQSISEEEINTTELAIIVGFSFFTSGKGIDSNHMRGVYKQSKNVLKTAVSPRKIAMYTGKIVDVKRTVGQAIAKSVVSKAISGCVGGIIDRYDLRQYAGGVFGI